jgi:hypothetical protein
MGLVSQNYDGGTPNVGIQAHPRHMQDNDEGNVQAWHKCGIDDGLWKTHASKLNQNA